MKTAAINITAFLVATVASFFQWISIGAATRREQP